MDNNKFTNRDSKADTADLDDLMADVAEIRRERRERTVSYRERQRAEQERLRAQREANGETVSHNPYINTGLRRPYEPVRTFNSDTEQTDYSENYNSRNYYAEDSEEDSGRKAKRSSSKKKEHSEKNSSGKNKVYKVLCAVLGSLLGVIIIVFGIGIWYFSSLDINNIDLNGEKNNPNNAQYTQNYEDENGEEIRVLENIYEGSETDSFNNAIKEWKNQGSAYLKSNKVINVLLAGIDRNYDGSDGRSDTMILASVNLKTKTITLSSFYRDVWMYESFDNDTRHSWAKLNAAYVYGGPQGLIENIEDYYKIQIDHFVSVDFQTFQDIVNAVGGVTVPVQDYEADFINDQTNRTNILPGEAVKLQGDEALAYVRMRHTDADGEVSRTRRQRQFISALIDEFKSISLTELDTVVNTLFQYVETDMTKTDIVKLGARALAGKWYNFELKQQQVPDEPYRMDYYKEDVIWMWVTDYAGAAYQMQMNIYGYSNIVLNENRYTIIDIARDYINGGYDLV